MQKNYLVKSDLDSIKTQENIASSKPDILLPKLINLQLNLKGSVIPKEVQYLFVAWNLRNFAGHNIQTQNVISREFDKLLKILISDIFLVIEEFRGIT